jgi:hypothetical protein
LDRFDFLDQDTMRELGVILAYKVVDLEHVEPDAGLTSEKLSDASSVIKALI